jgi:DNA-binding IclR family transcriptional regulator
LSLQQRSPDRAGKYTSPALEKGLDVLELLANESTPVAQSQIAASLGRSVGEIFRVLQTLERRGYIVRDADSGLYLLSMRLLDLAGRQPPLRALALRAAGPMSRLSDATAQSCNLAVLDGVQVRVIAQQESPSDFGFLVRVGAAFPVDSTATGVVLLAFCHEDRRASILADLQRGGTDVEALAHRIHSAQSDGFAQNADARQPGILDLAFPVPDGVGAGRDGANGAAVAALTVPYVATTYSSLGADAVIDAMRAATVEIAGAAR